MNQNLIQCSPKVKGIISVNGDVEVRSNAVMFRNKGNTVVYLDDNLSIFPGENFSVGSEYMMMVVVWRPKIRFERLDKGTLIQRLEIVEFEMIGGQFTNFKDQTGK